MNGCAQRATNSSFMCRQAAAELIGEPTDVSKNKSLLASREFIFIFSSLFRLLMSFWHPIHLVRSLATFDVSLSWNGFARRARAHPFLFERLQDSAAGTVTVAVTVPMFFTLPPAS